MGAISLEAVRAANKLAEENIGAEVIVLRTVAPLDDSLILNSIRRTRHLVVVDQGTLTAGFAAEIVARVTDKAFTDLKSAPELITLPDVPAPATRALSNYYYPTISHIVAAGLRQHGRTMSNRYESVRPQDLLDIPDRTFTGPF